MRDIADRRELFLDDWLIERADGVHQLLHEPTPREVAIVHDEPWEGSGCGYHTIFRDGPICRMYYHAWQLTPGQGKLLSKREPLAAYAQSDDGATWHKPRLGLVEFNGSKDNNLLSSGPEGHDFGAFRDDNPACDTQTRYKCVAHGGKCDDSTNWHNAKLCAHQSPDGIHFRPMGDGPILTGMPFDTQNIAFWDGLRGQYRAYVRDYRKLPNGRVVRDIKTAVSDDFLHWSEPVFLEYPQSPDEHLYTNQIQPYYRAPHIFIGFPARYVERSWGPSLEALPNVENRRLRSTCQKRYGTAVTDGLLMSSRDGRTFLRWPEVFLRPGLRTDTNWAYGDNYIACGMLETPSHLDPAVPELSLFATENYWIGTASRLRRFTLRVDGFVSMHAGRDGGELVTPPLTFSGSELTINYSTAAAGLIRVEIQDEQGRAIDGHGLEDCVDIFGDSLDRVVGWQGGADVRQLAGRPVRLRIAIKDADLYSLQFRQSKR